MQRGDFYYMYVVGIRLTEIRLFKEVKYKFLFVLCGSAVNRSFAGKYCAVSFYLSSEQ